MRRWVAIGMVGFVLTTCGGDGMPTAEPAGESATTLDRASGFRPETAAVILDGLRARIPTITETTVYDETTDPNDLLGRPGQYTSKAGFHDSRVPAADLEFESHPFAVRRGGDIEVFPSPESAKRRADYIDSIVNHSASVALGGPEYIYLERNVLLRVSRSLTPAQASEYKRALRELVGD